MSASTYSISSKRPRIRCTRNNEGRCTYDWECGIHMQRQAMGINAFPRHDELVAVPMEMERYVHKATTTVL
jgi:hypothetical protein